MEAYVDFVGRQWLGFGDVNLGDVGPALGRDERFGGVLGEGHPDRAVPDVGRLNLVGGQVDDGDGISELICHDEAFAVTRDGEPSRVQVDLCELRADDRHLDSAGFHEFATVELVRADLVVAGSAGEQVCAVRAEGQPHVQAFGRFIGDGLDDLASGSFDDLQRLGSLTVIADDEVPVIGG